VSQVIDSSQWTGELVRELLVVLYGGHRSWTGSWVPDAAAVARRRRVARGTVRHWTRHGSPIAIPVAELDAIVRRRRPKASTLRRERLQADRTQKMRERASLGRGRGNLTEYAERGWLDQHRVLVLEDEGRPLRRVVVVRDEPALIRRATAGARLVDLAIADSKFAGDALRYQLLQEVGPWRLELPTKKAPRGHTQVWLASAPVGELPVSASLT
jgi:hypothetical protein